LIRDLWVSQVDSTDAWAIVEGAVEHFNHGEFREAIDSFVQSIQASPSDPRMHFNLALALAKLGENIVALDVLKKGLDLDPHDKVALRLLALLYAIVKKGDRNALGTQSFTWVGRFLKDKDFLANYIDGVVASRVVDAIIVSMAGFAYVAGGMRGEPGRKRDAALANTAIIDAYRGSITMCYAHLSLPCLSGNAPDDVMDYVLSNYEGLADEDKGTGLLWVFERGRRLYEDADYSEAAHVLEGLVAAEPTNLAILFFCGKALRDSGEADLVKRSIDYYKRILQLNYENALGWYDLSLSYAILGDFEKELFCLQRAFDLGHSRQDIERITYLEGITFAKDPFE
jgi:tetratricopeptide (TPR) repeat protein